MGTESISRVVIDVSLGRLTLMLIPLAVVGWVMWKWSGGLRELGVATGRMVGQLLVVGYLLVFLFESENWILHVGVVGFMVVVSAWIAIRTVKEGKVRAFGEALLAIGLGGGSVFLLVIFGVLQMWDFEARYVIPLAGMSFANAMTAVTLAAERLEAEVGNGQDFEEGRRAAWNASLIPQINSFLAVGLVSLPGMMTGQILAGASPLDAVRYQILVMAMVLGSAGISVAIYLWRRRVGAV
ncbi:MAG: ABC transporter permease [Verrucomicrobiota bacterium]